MIRYVLAGLCAALAGTALPLAAETWTVDGQSLEAKPDEVLGSVALFDQGAIVPLGKLSDEDCVRFHNEIKDKPQRVADWSQAKSPVSEDIYGRVMRLEGDHLVPADLKGRPEPELYLLFFATNSESRSWDMIGKSTPDLFKRLQKIFPGQTEGLLFGVKEGNFDHISMATSMTPPWLVTDFRLQVEMDTIRKLIPSKNYGLVVTNRDGVPIFGPNADNEDQVKATFVRVVGLLDIMRPENPKTWKDRLHYLRAVQLADNASGKSDPVLVGNPLVADGLRQRKITKVDAVIHVGADGKPTSVELKPEGIPAPMVAPLADALKRVCQFAPAVDHGTFVAGTYAYHMDVGP